MKTLCYPPLVALCALLATPCTAQEKQIGPDRYAATVRADLHPDTPAAARRALARIDAGALAACGVSSFSLREVVVAERRSACWRDAMAGAMAKIDNVLLLQAWHRQQGHKDPI